MASRPSEVPANEATESQSLSHSRTLRPLRRAEDLLRTGSVLAAEGCLRKAWNFNRVHRTIPTGKAVKTEGIVNFADRIIWVFSPPETVKNGGFRLHAYIYPHASDDGWEVDDEIT